MESIIAFISTCISLAGTAYRDRGVYTVELRPTTGQRIMLFRFYSEGDFINDGLMPDFMFWDEYLEATLTKGDQGREAEAFGKIIAGLVGMRIHSD